MTAGQTEHNAFGLFITGTDTDVGKTVFTTGLIKFFLSQGINTLGVKPLCCGSKEDLVAIQEANTSHGALKPAEELINPLYLSEPAAPKSTSVEIPPLSEVLSSILMVNDSMLIVEGAGGWAVPVCRDWDMEALAVKLNFPIILIVSNRLGALNHALLTAKAIESSGLPLLGFFMNTIAETEYELAQATNRSVLEELLPCPCLGEIPPGGATISSEALCNALKIPHNGEFPLHFFPPNS